MEATAASREPRAVDEEELLRRVGARIRDLRRAGNLSLETLGEKADLHPTHLSAVERGQRNPSLVSLAKIARGLGVDIASLLDVGHRSRAAAKSALQERLRDAAQDDLERLLRIWDALRG